MTAVALLALAASLMHSEIMMARYMPIRIRHCDKNRTTAQQDDISLVISDAIVISHASYRALAMVSGVLYGSI